MWTQISEDFSAAGLKFLFFVSWYYCVILVVQGMHVSSYYYNMCPQLMVACVFYYHLRKLGVVHSNRS